MIDFSKRQAVIVRSTPAIIDYLLSINTHNRAVKKSVVEALKRQIENGDWCLTNQGVGVTASGFVADGQHRLIAIKECGFPPVEFVLVTGLDDNAQTAVDTHAKRSQSDIIKLLLNQTISNQVVASVNLALTVRSIGDRFTTSSKKPSVQEVADFISEFSDMINEVHFAIGSSMRSGVTAALLHYAMKTDVMTACELADQTKTGVELRLDDPAYRLRKWLTSNKSAGGAGQVAAYSVTVSACIAHYYRQSISILRPSTSWDRLRTKRFKDAA